MNNFSVNYKILRLLEKNMDYNEFDPESISPASLGISRERRDALLVMLAENGYIAGLSLRPISGEAKPALRCLENTVITLKGLEYLEENSLMRKAAEIAKGIAEMIH